MDDKITTIKDRVLQVAKYKGIRLELFLQEIGMSYSSFKGESKKTPLNGRKYPQEKGICAADAANIAE